MREFFETKKLFAEAMNWKEPLSYEQWLDMPDDFKVGALFVQFFPEVTLAYHKTKTAAASDIDCLEECMMYLMKNVYGLGLREMKLNGIPKFDVNRTKITEKAFNPKYIYRICYNAMYCKSVDVIKNPSSAVNNEQSNIIPCGEDSVDLFDLVESKNGDIHDQLLKDAFTDLLCSVDDDTKAVIEYLLTGQWKKLNCSQVLNTETGKTETTYKDSRMPEAEKKRLEGLKDTIIEELKSKLIEFKDLHLA